MTAKIEVKPRKADMRAAPVMAAMVASMIPAMMAMAVMTAAAVADRAPAVHGAPITVAAPVVPLLINRITTRTAVVGDPAVVVTCFGGRWNENDGTDDQRQH